MESRAKRKRRSGFRHDENRKLVSRVIIGHVVRRCEHCKTMKTAVVFADDNGKLLSERHVKIKCACDQYVTSALVVATLAQRLLRLEANEVERNEDTVLYRLQTSRTPEPDVTPEHHLRIRRFLNESQLRLKL